MRVCVGGVPVDDKSGGDVDGQYHGRLVDEGPIESMPHVVDEAADAIDHDKHLNEVSWCGVL